jgi:membrane fusion protein
LFVEGWLSRDAERVAKKGENAGGARLSVAGKTLNLITWSEQTAVLVLVAIALAILTFLFFGAYTKRVDLFGQVVPAGGQIDIHPYRTGYVSRLWVNDQQYVKKDQPLFQVSSEHYSQAGAVQHEVGKTLDEKKRSLNAEMDRLRLLHTMQAEEVARRLLVIPNQLNEVGRRIKLKEKAIAAATAAVERQRALAKSGYVSQSAIETKEVELAAAQADYSDALTARLGLEKELATVRIEQQSLALKQSNELAQISRQLSSTQQESYESEGQKESVTVAPESGVVTLLSIKVGQAVSQERMALVLLPKDTEWTVELFATSRSIGFLKVGQTVRLHFDAFPYQKFGLYSGKVITVSRAAVRVSPNATSGVSAMDYPLPDSDTYYRIQVALDRQCVQAYGKCVPLQAGMKVTGGVETDRKSLLEWIFDPLYAITGKL